MYKVDAELECILKDEGKVDEALASIRHLLENLGEEYGRPLFEVRVTLHRER
jgi:hypothetical protein